MSPSLPRILRTEKTSVSPWLEVIAREVQWSSESGVETYYAIGQPDYVTVLAITPEERLVLVRQYRPAIERFSLELPAGMIDPGEDPLVAASRELFEETGYPVSKIELIGKGATSSGRISNSTYSFFVRTGEQVRGFKEEPGVSVHLASASEMRNLILSGEFSEQAHLGAIAVAATMGLVDL